MNNIQKNFKAKSALRHCADGGRVSGPGGPVDDKVGPVMLSDKEYVLPADTVDAVGVQQLDALRAATHTPAGLRRTGNNPERAAMMQKQYAQPVTAGAPKQFTQLPLPEVAPKADMRPEKAFMYRDNLGDSLKGLRDKIPGLADGGMVKPEEKKNSWGFNDTLQNTDTTRLAAAGVQTVINALKQPPPRVLSDIPNPPPVNPNSVINQMGGTVRDPSQDLKRYPRPSGSSLGMQSTSSPLRTGPSMAPNVSAGGPLAPTPTAAPTVPGGNTLPAVRGPSSVIPNGPAAPVGGVPPIKDVPGEVLSRQPRLPAPETPEAAPKPSMLGKVLKYGGGLISGGMALKDINDNGLNLSNGTDLALSAGTMLPNKYAAGASMAGLVGKGIYQALPDDMQESVKSALSSAPGTTGEKPAASTNPRLQYQIGTNERTGPLADDAVIGGGAYDTMSDRIAKDALSRPAAGVPAGAPSVGGTAIAPTPGYQTEALGKLGVPESIQKGPALEQGARTLATAGKGADFQNLGTYGGDANLYGRASDPSRPGRINDFVGVGAKATAESALRGNTLSSNDAQVQRGRELLAQDAAQRSARGSKLRIGTADGELGSTEQRFGAMRREIQQKFGGAGQEAQLARHLQTLNENQSAAMAADAQTAQKADEARLNAETDRYVSDNTRDSYKYTADMSYKAAEATALGAAGKTALAQRTADEKAVDADIKDTAKTLSEGDAAKEAALSKMLTTMPPKMQANIQNMSPQARKTILQAMAGVYSQGMNMEPGRSVEGMVQNGAIAGGLAGAGSLAANKFTKPGTAAKVGDLVDGTAMILSRGKYKGHVARGVAQGASLGIPTFAAIGGAYATPKNQPTDRSSPLQYNPDGTPMLREFNWNDAMTNGIFSTLWDDNYQRVDGRLVNKAGLTPDMVDQYRMIFEANQ